MNKTKAQKRIEKLRVLINKYRYNYHVLDKSIMSEASADSLKKELADLENLYPELITPDSPTQRVSGAVLKQFTSVKHQTQMLSLNDVFSVSEISDWITRSKKLLNISKDPELFLDIKMDGLACSLIYVDGILVQGVTRGDGYQGEDVTNNIKTIEAIPLNIRGNQKYSFQSQGRVEIRGEIVMFKKDFIALNEERKREGLKLFANPRNTAAGTIRQLDSKLVAKRKLHFIAYDLIDPQKILKTNFEVYKALAEIGFRVNNFYQKVTKLVQVEDFLKTWDKKREQLPFNSDGVVLKINNREDFSSLGIVGKAPRGAVAYKFSAEQSTTRILDIFVSIGRTGLATPVAILKPVQIAGSLVQMATLHNEQEIQKKDIRINDTVIVHKAGDIIPEVVKPLKELRDGSEKVFRMPKLCPICHKPLSKTNLKDIGLRCQNSNCPSRIYKQIIHFGSKEALDIEGLGEKNVIALVDNGLINDQADLYKIKKKDLIKLDRFGEISSEKLINNIIQKKEPLLRDFIYGLGILHVGSKTALDLARHFNTLDNLKKATEQELENIEGIGKVVAESLIEWFNNPANQVLLKKFEDLGLKPQAYRDANLSTTSKITNKKFVISGTLNSMTREEAIDKIIALGGEFGQSVSRSTDYIVLGNNPGKSKIAKARQLDIKIIDEQKFLSFLI